jgi:hypothetical protein
MNHSLCIICLVFVALTALNVVFTPNGKRPTSQRISAHRQIAFNGARDVERRIAGN